jgi:hypothetical protein
MSNPTIRGNCVLSIQLQFGKKKSKDAEEQVVPGKVLLCRSSSGWEDHPSDLKSLMPTSYAVSCLKKKKRKKKD